MRPGDLVVRSNPTALDAIKLGLVICSTASLTFETILVLWTWNGNQYNIQWMLAEGLERVTDKNAKKLEDRWRLRQ